MGCGSTLETAAVDIGATLLAPETGGLSLDAIPVLNAGVAAANGAGVKGSLLAGGEALAGQEVAGAFGVGEGNDAFNSVLGITGDNPAGTGLPDIGGAFNSAIGAVDGGTSSAPVDTTNAAGATVDSATGQTVAAPAASTSVTPSSGAPVSASQSIDLSSAQPAATLGENIAGTSTAASPGLGVVGGEVPLSGASADSAIGAAGTDAIGSTGSGLTNQFAQASGVQQTPSFTPPSTDFSASAPAAAGAAAPAAASPSIMSQIESAGIKAAIPLGGLAYDAIKGPAKLPSQDTALETGGAATAPLLAMENAGANEAATGQLTQPQQAQVLQYVQQSQNQLLQQLASAGVQNPTQDSRYIQGMQQIQQNALALQNQYITQAISEATSAGGAASSNIASVANQQAQLDKGYQDSLAAAFAGLGGGVVQRAAS